MHIPPSFLIAAFVLVGTGGFAAEAQERIDMPEFGMSVEVPAAWEHVKTYKITDPLPAFGLYHLQEVQRGRFLAVRDEACASQKRQEAWTRGKVAAKLTRDGDALEPLRSDAKVRFSEYTGFERVSPRGGMNYKAYVFYLSRNDRCYEVSVGAPEQEFETSSEAFQGILDGLSFAH